MSDLFGKYWIIPHRRLHQDLLQASATEVIDCTLDEHARYARAAMLGLSDFDDKDALRNMAPQHCIFKPMYWLELAARAYPRCDKEALKFLEGKPGDKNVDPRVYVIERYGWIRVRENRYYAWQWDALTTERLFFCEAYWKKQDVAVDSWLDFVELKTGREFGMRHDQALMNVASIMAHPGVKKCSQATSG